MKMVRYLQQTQIYGPLTNAQVSNNVPQREKYHMAIIVTARAAYVEKLDQNPWNNVQLCIIPNFYFCRSRVVEQYEDYSMDLKG